MVGMIEGSSSQEIQAIARESERMGRLVTDLLALARADAGQLLARRSLMLDALLVDVYQQARYQAPQVRLIDRGAGAGRDARRSRPAQTASLQPGGQRLPLHAARRNGDARADRTAGVASISIRDTGPGIPPEDLPRIFERFYRADHARSREVGGTGLGLAISQVIAEAHGGQIEVDSQVGAGSTFTVHLPTHPSAVASAWQLPGSGVLTTL